MHIEMETCSKCDKKFYPSSQEYLCGYGKCSDCCGDCMHRPHRNPNHVNRQVLGDFFSKMK